MLKHWQLVEAHLLGKVRNLERMLAPLRSEAQFLPSNIVLTKLSSDIVLTSATAFQETESFWQQCDAKKITPSSKAAVLLDYLECGFSLLSHGLKAGLRPQSIEQI